MTTTREKVAALMPLVERMNRSHCWIRARTLDRRKWIYRCGAKPQLSSKPCEEASPLLDGWFGDPASSQGFLFGKGAAP